MATFSFTVPSSVPPDPTQTYNRGFMDLSGAVLMLASGNYNVVRREPPVYVSGRRQEPAHTTIPIIASVQPASGFVVERLPEGKRDRETIMLYTRTRLQTANTVEEADFVYIDGGTFEVETVQRWNRLGNFYECVLTRRPGT